MCRCSEAYELSGNIISTNIPPLYGEGKDAVRLSFRKFDLRRMEKS